MSTDSETGAPKITAYLKTHCGWSEGVRAIFRKYDLDFEEKDIIQNQAFRWEMEQKSGQPLSPCVINTLLHMPLFIAATACRTCSMNEQPPTEVPSTQLGVMPR